jgi:hypothetical protein
MFGSFCNGLSGIFAYGIQQMDGLAGYGGWRWIFIIEGIFTVLIGLCGYIWLVDFPDVAVKKNHWRFLSTKELEFILRRINKDRNDAEAEPFSFKRWAEGGLDLKIWGFAMIFL